MLLVASVNSMCRFPFHMQVMILMKSYNRLSSLTITSVDGCCLYIIIQKVCYEEPDQTGWHTKMAGQHQKK